MTSATTAQLATEAKSRREQDAVLATAIASLSARVYALEHPGVVTPPVDPPVTPPPTGQVVKSFNPSMGGPAELLVLAHDPKVDVIELTGTFPRWSIMFDVGRTALNPLLIRPASGAAVVFDGGGSSTPPFYVGWQSPTSYVTIDAAGGSITISSYQIKQIGLVDAKYTDHVTFNGLTIRNCGGTVSAQTSHCLYIESDGTHRSKAFTANGWDVIGPSNRFLNGIQTYHSPNVDGLVAHGWKVSSLHRAAYLWADASGVDIDGWTITDCDATIDAQEQAKGTVKNCRAKNSGSISSGLGYWKTSTLLDGGGNVIG